MFQIILQFIILPFISGAFFRWVFFKVLWNQVSEKISWLKISLWLLLAAVILLIPGAYKATGFSLNLLIGWLSFLIILGLPYFALFIISIWFGLELGRILKSVLLKEKLISRRLILPNAIVGGLTGGLMVYLYSALFGDTLIYDRFLVVLVPLFVLVGVVSGALGGVLGIKSLKNETL